MYILVCLTLASAFMLLFNELEAQALNPRAAVPARRSNEQNRMRCALYLKHTLAP